MACGFERNAFSIFFFSDWRRYLLGFPCAPAG
jgi:hypothetical protein